MMENFQGATGRKGLSTQGVRILPSMSPQGCGKPVTRRDRPGYTLCPWVDGFAETPAGDVPRVRTRLSNRDRLATFRVRCGIGRFRYTVVPGLYAVGRPDADSEVLVTANFKLTFDHLRQALEGTNAWILVLDTHGINVWCAAGKGTFGTDELVARIEKTSLEKIVAGRRLIVPQLGATGVSAQAVRARSGFRVVYGPVRAADLQKFLANGRRSDPAMREVTFSLRERAVLTPVELQIALKPALWTALALLVLSGLGPGFFSPAAALGRGTAAIIGLMAAIAAGAVAAPLLLPVIPVRAFALKGIITGIVAAIAVLTALAAPMGGASAAALFLFIVTVSSYLAMNFTGSTPFTCPSGVEKEMKQYIPVQLAGLLAAAGLWVYGAF